MLMPLAAAAALTEAAGGEGGGARGIPMNGVGVLGAPWPYFSQIRK